ncbi:hypothetical protein ET445_13905 [Agromyces protaetiae]|uniref:VWA domain-containing protein n=1 Tax=Agromyces protaetiae TaxID=2509455 RepID=A0A4P6FJU8_9MICO|nr:hypothetical protein [Agromyces protaetiae]QAY74257.1 hypothetical protein ET445_13905 [Agromyces protaetiae]
MTPHLQPSGVLPGGILPLRPERTIREPYVELGWPGFESKTPSLDLLLFDDSGSVTAPHGTDPVGNRFAEAWNAIRLVAEWTHTSRAKVAVLHFDHPVGASEVTALNHRRLEDLLRPSLAIPRGGLGTSDLLPSLEAAEIVASEHPEHDVRLTVFSDFQLTDPDPRVALTALEAFPGAVHAVVLSGGAPRDLDGAANVTVTPLRASDPPGSFAAAIHRSLTTTRRGHRYSVLHRGTSTGRRP